MSTKKDVGKSTSTRKVSSTTSKINAKTRGDSKDRKKSEKMEVPVRNKTVNIENRTTKKKEVESDTKAQVPKISSRTSIDPSVNNKNLGPKTPSGSKISRTQYFPSKNMYSNALKDKSELFTKNANATVEMKPEIAKKSSRKPIKETEPSKKISTTTEKLESARNVEKSKSIRSPREKLTPRSSQSDMTKRGPSTAEPSSLVSNISAYSSPDASSSYERPRTATLRKGSIVNANIVGPDAPKTAKHAITTEHVKTSIPKSDEELNYEEDFDSYESDFEQYSSVSSNIESSSSDETSSITSSEVEPSELKFDRKKVSSAGSDEERKLDSGHFDMTDYKHKQILDNIKESVEKENTNLILNNNPSSLSDEGFEEQKSLQMINFLDAQKKYEHKRNMQIKKKRGEDILSMIRLVNYSFTLFDLSPLPYDVFIKRYGSSSSVQVSVQTGEDDVDENIQTEEIESSTKWTQAPTAFSDIAENDPQFWRTYKCDFVGVGNDTYEEYTPETEILNEHSLRNFFASAGNLILRILEESRTEHNCELKKNSRAIPFSNGYVSLNTSADVFKETTVTYVTFSCDTRNRIMTLHSKSNGDNMLAVWGLNNPEQPEALYSSHGVSCCSFGPETFGFIFAGLNSGAIILWNTKQRSSIGAEYFTDIGVAHESKIIGLHAIRDISETSSEEICSLDEDGNLILWTVIMKKSSINSSATSALLVLNSRISLQKTHPDLVGLQCTDFAIDYLNTNMAFISTNYGYIIHHLIKGGKNSVKMFYPESPSVANCLELCPFSPNYFLVGHQNGDVNLYSHTVKKPLMVFADKESNIHQCGIEEIQWSRNRPFVIYTKDKSNRIHIWDLSENDMHPIYSIPYKDNIKCMRLSSSSSGRIETKSYLVIGTEDGSVHLHQLNEEHAKQSIKIFDEQVKMFFNYVSRL